MQLASDFHLQISKKPILVDKWDFSLPTMKRKLSISRKISFYAGSLNAQFSYLLFLIISIQCPNYHTETSTKATRFNFSKSCKSDETWKLKEKTSQIEELQTLKTFENFHIIHIDDDNDLFPFSCKIYFHFST